MSTQPPHPPPANPRRPDYTFVWVLAGVLAVATVLLFSGVYIFSLYLARQVSLSVREQAGGKAMEIETPVGSLRVRQGEVGERELGLPIYPGAQRARRHGATVSIEVPSEKMVNVAAAEFETTDPLDRVADFYRQRLGPAFTERRHGDAILLERKSDEKRKTVVLRREGGRTRIGLATVDEGGAS